MVNRGAPLELARLACHSSTAARSSSPATQQLPDQQASMQECPRVAVAYDDEGDGNTDVLKASQLFCCHYAVNIWDSGDTLLKSQNWRSNAMQSAPLAFSGDI